MRTPVPRGEASVEVMLGLGIILPLLVVVFPAGRRMMQLVYEFTCTCVAWPFL